MAPRCRLFTPRSEKEVAEQHWRVTQLRRILRTAIVVSVCASTNAVAGIVWLAADWQKVLALYWIAQVTAPGARSLPYMGVASS